MMNNRSIALAVVLVAVGTVAMAQTGPVRPAYQFPSTERSTSGPAAVQLGDSPVYAAPFASVSYGNDSNVTTASRNEISSPYLIAGGGVNLNARDERSVFNMSLLAYYGRYSDSTADNYADGASRMSYDYAFTQRDFARVYWDYVRGHDPRGSTDRTILLQGDPDKYYTNTPGIMYAHGAPGAEGRFEVFGNKTYKRYLNNKETTAASDKDVTDYGGAFYWRVMPKTYLLAEARGSSINYLDSTSTYSGNESRYYLGATWEATAATSGTLKVGQLKKDFDSTNPGWSGTGWEGMITWMPRTYSKVDLYSARTPVDSTGQGTFILSDATGINWNHDWSSVLTTGVNARWQKDAYQGFPRTDDIEVYGARIDYKFRRWVTFGAEYTYTKRDSNIAFYDYDKNLWLFSAAFSM
ncbi:MAG: outer membrane beta-barrel protein [Betaproteobacteria bacterium]|nr:outer membrane beta-barrel protein [Betaproteobacteria bacterium]